MTTFAEELYESVRHLEQPGSTDLWNFCQALGYNFEEATYLVREDENSQPPWSRLLSPTRTLPQSVNWLRQMAGVPPVTGESPDVTRQRIINGETYARGTPQSIIDKAATVGCTEFGLEERYSGNAYQVRFYFTAGQHTAEREKAIAAMLPAGIKYIVSTWGGTLYDDAEVVPDYDDLATAYTSNDDLRYN